jgi:hypothetical protein
VRLRRAITICLLGLALPAPGLARASRRPPPIDCGGSGVQAQYCIPLHSIFSFTATRVKAPCTLVVHYLLEPRVNGLRGRVELKLRGTDPSDRRVRRVATPRVSGGPLTYRFHSLPPGHYQLTGWYRGDLARQPSAHVHRAVVVRCR